MNALATAWRELRQEWSGEARYQRYLAHQREQHPGRAPLSREAFFREELHRKWHGVRRCC